MAVTFERLSGSTNGRPIKVVATGTLGTTIHTAHATSDDRVWLWAVNSSTSAVKLTLEWGGVTSPDDLIEVTIPPEDGKMLISDGDPLSGSLVLTAFAATANVINITGYVLRIS